jgi:hypothetical protein
MHSPVPIITVTPPPPPYRATLKLFFATIGVALILALPIFALSCCAPLVIVIPLGFAFISLGLITFLLLYFSFRC